MHSGGLAATAELLGIGSVGLASAASDREVFLRRPDLGRALRGGEAEKLRGSRGVDLALVVSGGLSSAAVEAEAPALLAELVPHLRGFGLSLSPLVLVELGRVGLSDAIGAALSARSVLRLIGERPGLGTPASMGAYLTYAPRPGRTDADRNCVSNIHARGLSAGRAAHKLLWLVQESLRQGLSGVTLKDESDFTPGRQQTFRLSAR
jgi:ethanolamine ammonia-lyase small subunit